MSDQLKEAFRRAGIDPDAPGITQKQLLRVFSALEASGTSTTRPSQETGEEPWQAYLADDPRSDQQIAIDILERETGSRKAALETLALDPGALQRWQQQIAQEREAFQTEAERRAKLEYEGSPEGLREAAKVALAAEQEKAELVEQAAALLRARGEYDPNDHPDTILKASGLVQPDPDPTGNDLVANIAAANSDLKPAADGGTNQ